MLPGGTPPDWTWSDVDIAVPRPSGRLPGISMAGFRQRVPALADIAMIAHPSVTVILDLSEAGGIVYDAYGRHQRGSLVAGLLPGQLRAGGWRGECLQIRLSPLAAAAVLGASIELTGTVAALDDIWGRDARQFEEKLRAAASWDERFAIAADVLSRRLGPRPPVDPEVAYTWRRTVASRGRVRVHGLADEAGWSRKRLWSRFRSQIGLTPKRAAQLVRFDHAVHLLAAGHDAASVAAQSGYADQSHLHREIKAIAGVTPTAVATAPWLAIDDVAWPAASRT
jgi:AraC-like DNA-binding protein